MLNKSELKSAIARAFADGVDNANTLTSNDFETTHAQYYVAEDEDDAVVNFGVANVGAPIATNAPKQSVFVGTIKEISRLFPYKNKPTSFFHWVTFSTERGDKQFTVSEKFVLANPDKFIKGVSLSVSIDHTIENKTTYLKEGAVVLHGQTGEFIANVINVTDIEKEILDANIKADSLKGIIVKLQSSLSHIDAEKNSVEYNAMATFAGVFMKR